MKPQERLIVALDFPSRDEILRVVDELHGLAGMFKVGLQAYTREGPDLVRELTKRGEKVFLDLKLHDIPNTVREAASGVASLGTDLLTVHAAGGTAMMKAAAAAAGSTSVLGVTVLTSLGPTELREIGLDGNVESLVQKLARLAQAAGLAGVVCSPREIALVRESCGRDFLIVTPGIRAAGDSADDQQRTMSAAEAIRQGADSIVVGRPITGAADRRAAAKAILEQLSK